MYADHDPFQPSPASKVKKTNIQSVKKNVNTTNNEQTGTLWQQSGDEQLH